MCSGRRAPYILVFSIIQSYNNRESSDFFSDPTLTCDVKMKGSNVTNDVSVVHHCKVHDLNFKFDVLLRP